MTSRVVCPACGSEVDRDALALDADLADLRARIDIPPTSGRVFLILFATIGKGQSTSRILSARQLLDALDIRARQQSTYDGLRWAFKRMKTAFSAAGWLVRVRSHNSVGWYLEIAPGWHWRDEPTTLQRQIAADEFTFKEG